MNLKESIRQEGSMYLIINADNQRLCQDNRWRGFAMFGTTPGCVKEYKSKGHAERKAKHIKGSVVSIPHGYTIPWTLAVMFSIPTTSNTRLPASSNVP